MVSAPHIHWLTKNVRVGIAQYIDWLYCFIFFLSIFNIDWSRHDGFFDGLCPATVPTNQHNIIT